MQLYKLCPVPCYVKNKLGVLNVIKYKSFTFLFCLKLFRSINVSPPADDSLLNLKVVMLKFNKNKIAKP